MVPVQFAYNESSLRVFGPCNQPNSLSLGDLMDHRLIHVEDERWIIIVRSIKVAEDSKHLFNLRTLKGSATDAQ